MLDSTIIRAHQHSAGAARLGRSEEQTKEQEAIGKSKGGWTTKVHLRCDGVGMPLDLRLTPGQDHDVTQAAEMIENFSIKAPGPGRPAQRPKKLVADKAYNSKEFRQTLKKRDRSRIPLKSNQRKRGPFDKAAYKERNHVERLINRTKQFRRLATRYEKMKTYFRAMWIFAFSLLLLSLLDSAS